MKKGKTITWIFAISIFIIGLFILFTQEGLKMDNYLKLCTFVVPLIGIAMGGVAGRSLIKEYKGKVSNE